MRAALLVALLTVGSVVSSSVLASPAFSHMPPIAQPISTGPSFDRGGVEAVFEELVAGPGPAAGSSLDLRPGRSAKSTLSAPEAGSAQQLAVTTSAETIPPAVAPLILSTSALDANFAGLAGSLPPSDGALAVGPAHVLEIVNGEPGRSNVAVYSKGGALLKSQPLADLLQIDPATLMSDPRAHYDPGTGRWFIVVLSINFSTNSARFHLAISQTADPTVGFCAFSKDQSLRNGFTGQAYADFPGLGMDEFALYVSMVRFSFFTDLAFETQVEMIPRTSLACSAASLATSVWHLTETLPDGRALYEVQPAIAHTPSGLGYMVGTSRGGSYAGIWSITHSLAPTLFTSSVYVGGYLIPPDSPQPGTSVLLDTSDARVASPPIYRNGSLWFAHSSWAAQGPYSAVRWYEVAPTTSTVRQRGEVWSLTTAWAYPALVVNAANDMFLSATAVGPAYAPAQALLSRSVADPLGRLGVGVAFTGRGIGYSNVRSSGASARWGDYFGMALDPDGVHVWAEGSYTTDGFTWRTAVASAHATVPGPASYQVKVSDSSPLAGATVTVVAQALDAANQPVTSAGQSINWQSSPAGTFGAPSSTTDLRGIATVLFTTTRLPGTYTVTAADAAGARGISAPFTTRPRPAPTATLNLPNVTKTLGGPGGWTTPFYVQNTGTSPTDLEVIFYRFSDGAQVAQRIVTALAPNASYSDSPNLDADLPENTQFSVVVNSFGSSIVGVVNQLQGSGASTEALSYSGALSGSTRLYVPNVTRRFFGYDVPLIIQNLGSSVAAVNARFVSFDGAATLNVPLAVLPGRSGVIDPDFTPGLVDGTQYAVTVTSDQPVSVVANAHNEAGAPVAFSHNALSAGSLTLFAPYAVKGGSDGRFSPVVVQNIGSAPTDVTLAFSPLGLAGTSQSFVLRGVSPGASRAFDPRFSLGTTTPCVVASPTCLGPGEFSLTLTATAPIAALVLPVSNSAADAYSVPIAPASRLFLPVVQRTFGGPTGWNAAIVLDAPTGGTATLRWYRIGDGALVATTTSALVPGTAIWLDTRTVSALPDNGQYAVVVDATSPITAIVYQQAPAGDGSMIYAGFSLSP